MPEYKDNRGENLRDRDKRNNPDPASGESGSHPVGTGVGAVAGGAAGAAGGAAAGAAIGTAGAGPVGTALGAVAGAVAGGAAGHGIAESVNPTEEDAYWREHHSRESYYNPNYTYDDYRGAYQTGWEGYAQHGASGRRYEDVEPELRRNYESKYGQSRLSWQHAQPAVRAAWERHGQNLEDYIGYDVIDRNNDSVGTMDCIWTDHNGNPAFIGVRTGWLFTKTHVVPANKVEVGSRSRRIRLPYTVDKIKEAPAYEPEAEMTEEKEREVYSYYGITQHWRQEPARATQRPAAATRQPHEEASIPLAEEELRVGKREVEAGGVRLRKVVRTRTVNQPVELKREEIVIERVPAGEQTTTAQAQAGHAFEQEEIYIPLRREEAVVAKETHVREEVRARKTAQTEREQVSDTVRSEDVEFEQSGEANRVRETGPARASRTRQQEERPRSQRLHDKP